MAIKIRKSGDSDVDLYIIKNKENTRNALSLSTKCFYQAYSPIRFDVRHLWGAAHHEAALSSIFKYFETGDEFHLTPDNWCK